MNLKKLCKLGIITCLLLGGMVHTVLADEGNGEIREPGENEETEVNWCSVGEYATGYAINFGYYSNPNGSDPHIMSAYKGYIADDCYSSFNAAYNRVKELDTTEDKIPIIVKVGEYGNRVAYAEYGVIYMNNSSSSVTYSIYNEPYADATKKTYINPTSQRDVLLLEMYSEAWAKVMISGVTGYLKLTNSSNEYIHEIIPLTFMDKTSSIYDDTTFYGYRVTRFAPDASDSTSMYLDVLRGTTNSYMVKSGYADRPSFMKNGKVYYSYDEHYFYDSFIDMTDDYRIGEYDNALNKTPFYNYYQYLPARAKTTLSGDDFNSYLLLMKPTAGDNVTYCYTSSGATTSCSGSYAYKYSGPSSILYNNGDAFLDGQDYYGINATLIYVKAILEGAYGMSTIARAKFNPFGVNAYDSAPFSSATKYSTVFEGIESQFQTVMSLGYANPYDAKGRYNGSHVGNKASGANTLYASDPNWGWKLASLYREIDAISGYQDMNYYQLAVSVVEDLPIYETSSMSTVVEYLKNYNKYNDYDFDGTNIPVIIVDSATKNGKKVYKVVMDRPTDLSEGYYYAQDSDYGWVYADDVMLINKAKDGYKDPADVGNISINGNVTIETLTTPIAVYTTSETKMYDSYRTDITSSYTSIAKDLDFVAIRAVTTSNGKYYEVITDYTTTPYRTRYISASALKVDKNADLVITQASGLNARDVAGTNGSVVGQIKNERSPLLYQGTVNGEEINGESKWFKVLLNPLTQTSAYVSAAYATTEAPDDVEIEEPAKPVKTDNYLTSMIFDTSLYINGTGIIDGVETPTEDSISYTLVMTDSETGDVYTHPLKTTTNMTQLGDGTYNYDYSWYEGYVTLTKVYKENGKKTALPTGKYTLAIRAESGDEVDTFDVYNKNELGLQSDVVVRSGMTYSVVEDKNHIVSLQVINANNELDLSAYSAMNMNVYENSRVTSITQSGNGFMVTGYMFEANADCIYTDARNWREIVFVNTEDSSTEFAYRKQTTPVYKTWLNSNPIATANGKYRLDYAEYKVTVNPNSVNAYVGNVPNQKMAAGDYYVYMRISNGKTSYLFPLVDRTLSDGTNMENTNSLPDGFSVYDEETRALVYSVK